MINDFNFSTEYVTSIFDSYGIEYEMAGRLINVLCPFHADKSFGSAKIDPARGFIFQCFSCGGPNNGKPTNLPKFISKKLNIHYYDALRILNLDVKQGLDRYVTESIENIQPENPSSKKIITSSHLLKHTIRFNPDDYYYTKLKHYDQTFVQKFNVKKIHNGYYKDYYVTDISSKKLNIQAFEFRKLIEYETLKELFKKDESLPELRDLFKGFKEHYSIKLLDYKTKQVSIQGSSQVDPILSYLLAPRILYNKDVDPGFMLFNYDDLDFNKPLILTESVAGVPILRQIFNTSNVTATFRAIISPVQYELLNQFKEIIFIPDNDIASLERIEAAIENLYSNLFVIPLELTDKHPDFYQHLQRFYKDNSIIKIPAVTYVSRQRNNLKRIAKRY